MKKKALIIAAVCLLALAAIATPMALRQKNVVPADALNAENREFERDLPSEKEESETAKASLNDELDNTDVTPPTSGGNNTPSTLSPGSGNSGGNSGGSTNTPIAPTNPTAPTNPDPAPTQPTKPTPPAATSFDSGTVCSSVISQVGGFMTWQSGPSTGMGWFEYSAPKRYSQDKITSELVGTFQFEASTYGNMYFDLTYLGEWDSEYHFRCYRA